MTRVNNFKMGVIGMAVLATVTLSSLSQAQEIRVAAGSTPAALFKTVQGPFEKVSGLKLTIAVKGGIDLLKDLDAGAADLCAAGLSFVDWMASAEKGGYKIPDKNAYKSRVIGKDLVKVVLHKDNPVRKLTSEQLQGIFSGKITNWKAVGGKDEAITLFRSTLMPGAEQIFQRQVMAGEPFAKSFKEVGTLEEVSKAVSQFPGGVGFGVAGSYDGSVSTPAVPEVGRPITAITKGAPSANVVKLFDFIRGEGQKYLAK